MKSLHVLLIGLSLVGPVTCLNAQTRLVKPAEIHSFGTSTEKIPRLRKANVYGSYKIVFSVTKLPVVRMDDLDEVSPESIPNDRVNIAPGVEIIVPPSRKNSQTGPEISISAKNVYFYFEKYLTDPKIFSHAELNQIQYQLDRGYYRKSAYRFFGITKSHGKTYIGVTWYSPAASDEHDT